ncbi:hypothetical protein ABZ801_28125 [Actinomadura sp. NPDC047616]|uniref:hypothetical protein n=1 Tax=Actinomadura sp. NPDC047616 TaxID=3155914 RepID=UPI0033CF35F8
MTTLMEAAPAGRLRTAWRAAHDPVAGVPRWARIAAYAVPFTVLPSSVWRIAVCTFHAPIVDGVDAQGSGNLPWWLPLEVYVILLSVVSELLAFTAVGLVARWGEVFPRWVPVLRGRRVPPLAAVVPAALGATVLTALWTVSWGNALFQRDLYGRPIDDGFSSLFDPGHWQGVLALAAYLPLLLWGPLLGLLTVAYWRRRRGVRAR